MRSHIWKALGIAITTITLAGSAQAQDHGRGRDRDKHDDRDDKHRADVVRRADGDVFLVPRNRVAVPPGLAKKPGGLPPGQFKKRYTTLQGANTLSSVLRRRGYVVDRIGTTGNSHVVYYRSRDGIVHRALVSPGTQRLGFTDVPSSLMQQVMSALYGM